MNSIWSAKGSNHTRNLLAKYIVNKDKVLGYQRFLLRHFDYFSYQDQEKSQKINYVYAF